MSSHPLFDFDDSEEAKHRKALFEAFEKFYASYVKQGGRIYEP